MESNENIEMQQKVNKAITSEDQRKLFKNLSKLLTTKKAILYGWPTIQDKYSKNLKKKNDFLAWCQDSA